METFITIAVFIVCVGIVALFLGRRGILELAARILPTLVREAEEAFGSGCGKEKLEAVLSHFREAFPSFFRPFLSTTYVSRLIEETIAAMRAVGELHSLKKGDEE